MQRVATWAALFAGSVILLICGFLFVELARVMAPFGGIPFSWELLWLNANWLAACAIGLALATTGLTLLIRGRRRDG